MKKILILANHRKNRSPGQRFRFEQYIDYLNQNGFDCELSSLLTEEDDKIFYSKGNWISKLLIFIKCFNKRLKDVKRVNQFDIVFVFREAFFTGTTYFEKRLSRLPVKVVFDFDDSIWLPNVSMANKRLEWLKNYDKTSELIKLSDLVFAGNQYLADYAKKFNANVKLIPTTIDTFYHVPNKVENIQICIGWTGSSTTLKYFEDLIPVLLKIKHKYADRITFKVIVDVEKKFPELGIRTTPWSLVSEIEELNMIDIGIMPLPKDEWAKGKCGFKGLQYMALEIPTLMSPVGVNCEIIQNGVNGFLPTKEEDWIEKISELIESKELRKKIGRAGRETVVENYSVSSQKMNYLNEFKKLILS